MKIKRCYLAFVFFLLAACAPGRAPNIVEVTQIGDKRVVINDSILAKKLVPGDAYFRWQVEGGEAQVLLQNAAKRDVRFEYRFIWYDANGFEVSSITAWLPAILSAGEERGYKSTAPNAAVVRFKFMVRSPQPLTDQAQ